MINYIVTDSAKELIEQGLLATVEPTQSTEGSNGYDLYAALPELDVTIRFNEVVKIPTGVKVWLGEETDDFLSIAGLLLPRSSNKGLVLTNTIGLADADYQGEIFFSYKNTNEDPVTIRRGTRIGQLVLVPTLKTDFREVAYFEKVTSRGEGGFGSTGK